MKRGKKFFLCLAAACFLASSPAGSQERQQAHPAHPAPPAGQNHAQTAHASGNAQSHAQPRKSGRGASAGKSAGEHGGAAPHARPWAFGQSASRSDAIWRNGMAAQEIRSKATGRSADTTGGIDRALRAASEKEKKKKGGLGLSMENEGTTFKVDPGRSAWRADENLNRAGRHVVRAFADVEPSDDLSINVGPELILKDESNVEEKANQSQPDSVLGLGMHFKYDF